MTCRYRGLSTCFVQMRTPQCHYRRMNVQQCGYCLVFCFSMCAKDSFRSSSSDMMKSISRTLRMMWVHRQCWDGFAALPPGVYHVARSCAREGPFRHLPETSSYGRRSDRCIPSRTVPRQRMENVYAYPFWIPQAQPTTRLGGHIPQQFSRTEGASSSESKSCAAPAPTAGSKPKADASSSSSPIPAAADSRQALIRRHLLPLIELEVSWIQHEHGMMSSQSRQMDSTTSSCSVPDAAHAASFPAPSADVVMRVLDDYVESVQRVEAPSADDHSEKCSHLEQPVSFRTLQRWIEIVSEVLIQLVSATDWLPLQPSTNLHAWAVAELVTATISCGWQRWLHFYREADAVPWHFAWTIFWRKLEYMQAIAIWYRGVVARLEQSSRVETDASMQTLESGTLSGCVPSLNQVLSYFDLRLGVVPHGQARQLFALRIRRERLSSEQEEARWVEQALRDSFPRSSRCHNGTPVTTVLDSVVELDLISMGMDTLDCALLFIRAFFNQARIDGRPRAPLPHTAAYSLASSDARVAGRLDENLAMKGLQAPLTPEWGEKLRFIWEVFISEARPDEDIPNAMDELFAGAVLHSPPVSHAAALSILYREQRTAYLHGPSARPEERSGVALESLWAAADWARDTWSVAMKLLEPYLPQCGELLHDWSIYRWNTTFQGPVPRFTGGNIPLETSKETLSSIEGSAHRRKRAGPDLSSDLVVSEQALQVDSCNKAQRVLGISLRIAMAYHPGAALSLLQKLDANGTEMTVANADLAELVDCIRDELAQAISTQPQRSACVRQALSSEAFQWVQQASTVGSASTNERQHWFVWRSIGEMLTLFAADQTSEFVVRLVQLVAAFTALAEAAPSNATNSEAD
ncbi:hypothetical protein F1559_000667 [Cyanidiococcus yangmingshanensis]|uniref:Uncharacterized protein n=1 Tax=Cyanidiococcus yangmingshanensis TaxID=2690220 RepID=A0A7J7IBQ3_9RHOD|nr:hypothetical protein F1559_000667 [Cyanidiococcus yangmingshanensis]